MHPVDNSDDIQAFVRDAAGSASPFNIAGNSTKAFLGQMQDIRSLDVTTHCGIVSYEPTELVVTARTGTTLRELERVLAEHGQMMPFEPPVYNQRDTLGGVIACGLSGPRRAYAGSARDHVLGVRLVNGMGEHLRFGGEVIKNVAGYDVSRLQVGAMGTLGVLLEVSMKVLPKPETELTLLFENRQADDPAPLVRLARQPLPISASAVLGKQYWLRLSGSAAGVRSAANTLGGESLPDGDEFWQTLKTHAHPFFNSGDSLWRIAIADYAPALKLPGRWLFEWGGAQRWLVTDAEADAVFAACATAGAHATRYRGFAPGAAAFQPLQGVLLALHQRVRAAFDPACLFNPGRFHPEFQTVTSY